MSEALRKSDEPSQQDPIEAYKKALRAHDWYYSRSDDPSKHKRGKDQRKRLLALARALKDPDLARKLWQEHAPKLVLTPKFR